MAKAYLRKTLLCIFWLFTLELVNTIPTLNCPPQKQSKDHKHTKYSAVSSPIEVIEYKTDTIEKNTNILLMYLNGKIIRYYKENDNKYRMQLPYFAHENWHRHNDLLRFKKTDRLSPVEYMKLCVWDEISANLCAILTARYEYLCSCNKENILNRYIDTYMKFYFQAIKDGQIIPSIYGISEEECSILMNGVKDMWIQTYWPIYKERIARMVLRHIKQYKPNSACSSKYFALRTQMLTIGGIDFAKHMQSDIFVKHEKIDLIEQIISVPDLENDYESIADIICKYSSELSKMNLPDRTATLKHIVASCYVKSKLTPGKSRNFNLQSMYAYIVYKLSISNNLQQCITNIANYYPMCDKTTVNKKQITNALYKQNKILIADTKGKHTTSNTSEQNATQVKANSTKNTDTDHYSKSQNIKLPNFYQSILEKSDSAQIAEIHTIISEFEQIPDVLKNCNTQAQKEYIKRMTYKTK